MYSYLFELQAELLKALAHPRRLEIVHLLRDQELPVSDIHTMLDLPQANISQHLMVLRDAQVVVARREGKQIYYSLSHKNVIKASDLLRELLIDQHHDTLEPSDLKVKMKDLVPLVHDPVCHMRVSPKTAGFTHTHEGQTYYFCASGCVKKFKESPTQYVS
jgi:ArsR family transcriptional regulator, virulence genes transcriptional regulator